MNKPEWQVATRQVDLFNLLIDSSFATMFKEAGMEAEQVREGQERWNERRPHKSIKVPASERESGTAAGAAIDDDVHVGQGLRRGSGLAQPVGLLPLLWPRHTVRCHRALSPP